MARKTLADRDPNRFKKEQEAKNTVLNKPNVLQETIDQMVEAVRNTFIDEGSLLKFLSAFGVGDSAIPGEYYTCNRCGRLLPKKEFYASTEVGIHTKVTPICKKCAGEIAEPVIGGVKQPPTKDTVIKTLEFLRKPYLDTVWEASMLEAANTASGRTKSNIWRSYIKNIQMPNYYGLTYAESDFYTAGAYYAQEEDKSKDQEIIETFDKNKSDTLRLLGYLPFEKEKLSDQPFLYAQLIGFLDSSEDQNDDMMRTSSIITIVRSFLQMSQIDDMIAQQIQDTRNAQKSVATVKALQDMKKNIAMTVTQLAKESCISLKNTKNAKKGENTWTGKLKKIKELNLREGEVNGFDMNTCKGMQQVMELSDASIMKQLRLDESEWSDMVADQREMIRDLQTKLDFYAEAARLILRENLDLRDTLTENGISLDANMIDLEALYTPFIGDYSPEDDNENDDEVVVEDEELEDSQNVDEDDQIDSENVDEVDETDEIDNSDDVLDDFGEILNDSIDEESIEDDIDLNFDMELDLDLNSFEDEQDGDSL